LQAKPEHATRLRQQDEAKRVSASDIDISVVVPVFNEADNIGPLLARLKPVLDNLVPQWEIILIDDGSRDATMMRAREANAADARVGAVSLSRNFGKEIAIAAGLDHARGRAVIIMDADLQHPPETIPDLVAKWREGFVMVYAQRTDRNGESAVKRGFARLFYRLFDAFGETGLPEGAGDFRLIDRRGVEALRAMGERSRFSKGLYAWIGYKATGVPFEVGERLYGHTKWSFRKLFRFAFDGITSFSLVPLKVATYTGLLVSIISICTALIFAVRTLLYGTDVPGFPSLIVSVMFFSGIQLIFLGVIGEYVGRIFAEVKRRPLYLVGERLGDGGLGGAGLSESSARVTDRTMLPPDERKSPRKTLTARKPAAPRKPSGSRKS
jgi:polyisoprenyl-phosphate glycosyltransferase